MPLKRGGRVTGRARPANCTASGACTVPHTYPPWSRAAQLSSPFPSPFPMLAKPDTPTLTLLAAPSTCALRSGHRMSPFFPTNAQAALPFLASIPRPQRSSALSQSIASPILRLSLCPHLERLRLSVALAPCSGHRQPRYSFLWLFPSPVFLRRTAFLPLISFVLIPTRRGTPVPSAQVEWSMTFRRCFFPLHSVLSLTSRVWGVRLASCSLLASAPYGPFALQPRRPHEPVVLPQLIVLTWLQLPYPLTGRERVCAGLYQSSCLAQPDPIFSAIRISIPSMSSFRLLAANSHASVSGTIPPGILSALFHFPPFRFPRCPLDRRPLLLCNPCIAAVYSRAALPQSFNIEFNADLSHNNL
ncbi:hypothetical protein B0H13DRAFT_2353757 [Mycena leptocephala]|nr:hypothetical protein B0H13DRAFT_2353757 [Mycena leptocephala]